MKLSLRVIREIYGFAHVTRQHRTQNCEHNELLRDMTSSLTPELEEKKQEKVVDDILQRPTSNAWTKYLA
jgi:hypothetical protein